MNYPYKLTVTKPVVGRTGRLQTSRTGVQGSADLRRAVADCHDAPCLFSLSTADGNPVLYFMVDGDRAHLSAWEHPELCHYLTSDLPVEGDDSIDLGWNSYPAWSVTPLEKALSAAELYVDQRKLADWGKWRVEEM